MSKINDRIEAIFSHAVALQQDGRFRNTIHCSGKMIHVMNQDMTVILRFPIRQYETEFKNPISFFANDYDSKQFEERDGRICFIQGNEDYERTKSCKVPSTESKNPEKIWKGIKFEKQNCVTIKSSILSLLEDDLSHIEFSCTGGKLKVVQRNIFSGALIEIEKKAAKGLLAEKDSTGDFPVLAMRTNDFTALFSFVDQIKFYFSGNGYIYFMSISKKLKMDGIVSQCVYEEMKGQNDGRKKQKVRGSVKGTNQPNKGKRKIKRKKG